MIPLPAALKILSRKFDSFTFRGGSVWSHAPGAVVEVENDLFDAPGEAPTFNAKIAAEVMAGKNPQIAKRGPGSCPYVLESSSGSCVSMDAKPIPPVELGEAEYSVEIESLPCLGVDFLIDPGSAAAVACPMLLPRLMDACVTMMRLDTERKDLPLLHVSGEALGILTDLNVGGTIGTITWNKMKSWGRVSYAATGIRLSIARIEIPYRMPASIDGFDRMLVPAGCRATKAQLAEMAFRVRAIDRLLPKAPVCVEMDDDGISIGAASDTGRLSYDVGASCAGGAGTVYLGPRYFLYLLQIFSQEESVGIGIGNNMISFRSDGKIGSCMGRNP